MNPARGRERFPFHVGRELNAPAGTVVRLGDLGDITTRYRRPGPHTTLVTRLAVPGDKGDNFAARWHATQSDLARIDATKLSIDHLSAAVDLLTHNGNFVLLTADDDSAAYCWLTDPNTAEFMRVADTPCLVPALDEVVETGTVIGGIVDRLGVDMFVIDHIEMLHDSSRTDVIDEESVDRSRRRRRRLRPHARLEWRAGAARTAEQLGQLADRNAASLIVLTGDDRTVAGVAEELSRQTHRPVRVVEAGDRKTPTSRERLHLAAHQAIRELRTQTFGVAVDRLREELGQHDRAVAGAVATLEEISQHVVDTLFVDPTRWTESEHIDEIIRAALATGARVIPAERLDVDDGVAALLRTTLDRRS